MILQNDEGRKWGSAVLSFGSLLCLAAAAYFGLEHLKETRPAVLKSEDHWIFGQLGKIGGPMVIVYGLGALAVADLLFGRWARYLGLLIIGTGLLFCFAAQFPNGGEDEGSPAVAGGNYWEFVSKEGKRVDARLISFDGVNVKLSLRNGDQFTENISRFSMETREKIVKLSELPNAFDESQRASLNGGLAVDSNIRGRVDERITVQPGNRPLDGEAIRLGD